MAEGFEMRDIDRRIETDGGMQETSFDFPDVPIEQQTTEQLNEGLKIEEFINNQRKSLNITKDLDKTVYKNIKVKDGYLYYKNKRVSIKGGKELASIKTLQKNPEAREFLQKIGYEKESLVQPSRELETVSPEQTLAIKEKIRSFKVSEDWAKKEKEKAEKESSNE
jgi:hypothetical protein